MQRVSRRIASIAAARLVQRAAAPVAVRVGAPAFTAPVMTAVAAPMVCRRFNSDAKYHLDKEETLKRVMECVMDFGKVDADEVVPSAHFIDDLDLDQTEIVMALEQEFCIDIPDTDAEKIQTIESAAEYIARNKKAK